MNSPQISVVIPVYNAEKYIEQCLDSVIVQPMKDIEIICVNDGSTDNSSSLLDKYSQKDNRIHILHQENMHSGIARNNGLKMACGEYIHFLDADDYLTEDAYSNLYEKAKKFNLDHICGKAHKIETDSRTVTSDYLYSLEAILPEEYELVISFAEKPDIYTRIPYTPWRGIYSRRFLLDHNVDFNDILAFDDHIFHAKALSFARRIMFVDTYILYHRKGVDNSLVSNYLKRFECHLQSFEDIKKQCSNLPEELQKVILNAELKSIFDWYRRSLNTGVYFETNHNLMLSFIKHLDSAYIEGDTTFKEPWYLEYLILKDEVSGINNTGNQNYLISAVKKSKWKFLFDIIPYGAKVIIYTAGYSGQLIYKILTNTKHCEVTLWVDRDYKSFKSMGLPVSRPDDIAKQSFDFILIAANMENTANEIRNSLIDQNIPKYKIIWHDSRYDYLINSEEIQNFLSLIGEYSQFIIYGAAKVGEAVINFLQCINKKQNIISVAVSNVNNNPDKLLDVPILSIDRLKKHRKDALVLISTSEPYHVEINKNLISLGFKNIYKVSTLLKNLMSNIAKLKKNLF